MAYSIEEINSVIESFYNERVEDVIGIENDLNTGIYKYFWILMISLMLICGAVLAIKYIVLV